MRPISERMDHPREHLVADGRPSTRWRTTTAPIARSSSAGATSQRRSVTRGPTTTTPTRGPGCLLPGPRGAERQRHGLRPGQGSDDHVRRMRGSRDRGVPDSWTYDYDEDVWTRLEVEGPSFMRDTRWPSTARPARSSTSAAGKPSSYSPMRRGSTIRVPAPGRRRLTAPVYTPDLLGSLTHREGGCAKLCSPASDP